MTDQRSSERQQPYSWIHLANMMKILKAYGTLLNLVAIEWIYTNTKEGYTNSSGGIHRF
jgi:hypothetical protein